MEPEGLVDAPSAAARPATTGYMEAHLEANLVLIEPRHPTIETGAATPLPLIFDAAAGFGNPMHMRRTIAMSEAAGFQAIEIEDQ